MIYNKRGDGVMAQLVERLVRNEEASGSNPLSSTKTKTRLRGVFFVLVAKRSREPLNYQRFVRASKNNNVDIFSRCSLRVKLCAKGAISA